MKLAGAAFVCSLVLWVTPVGAQSTDPNGVSLDYRNVDLPVLIEVIAEQTGKNFIYDDRVRGQVTIISPNPMSPEQAFRVFESVLQVKGFTTVPAPGGLLKIVPTREAKQSPIETVPGRDATVPNRDLFITRLLPLRYVKADAVSNTLRPLVSKEANLIAYAPTNTLILTDTASNIRRLMTIISQIDVSTYQEQIKVIPIQYADASTLVGHLQEIFTESGGSQASSRTRTAAARRRARRTPGNAATATEVVDSLVGTTGEPRFITDERTNSIVVLATTATIRQVERFVALLDFQRPGTGRIHVYRLQNADAEDMAQTLASLTSGARGAGAGRPAGRSTGAAGAAGAAIADLGEGVRVTADGPTNSLIIQANAEAYSTLTSVIEALDIRRPQVLVEALIMEVGVDDDQSLGLGFLLAADGPDGSGVIVGRGGLRDPNSILSAGLDTFTSVLLGETIDFNGISVPVIQGVITASANDDNTNIISAPKILTADNEEAEIIVGENIPVPTSQLQTADPGAVSGFQTSQNITRQDVGVTLRVTPQISEGDTVRLQIFQEISEVQASADSDLGPTTTNRQVENTVYVRDGEAVMIGGIIQETQTESVSKVPWLGDIPILGWLFKNTVDEVRKTNLIIILTPHIVRDPGELNRLTVEGREEFRDSSRESTDLDDDEREQRRKALEAGLDLPVDTNPVRRELDRHSRSYPTEELRAMRAAEELREAERLATIAALRAREASGIYSVQVAMVRDSDKAVSLLEKLMLDGYDGTVVSRREMGEAIYAVQLGPYTSEDQAQHIAREMRAMFELNATVVIER